MKLRLIAAALLVLGCSIASHAQSSAGTVKGVVVDATGSPVSGANVEMTRDRYRSSPKQIDE